MGALLFTTVDGVRQLMLVQSNYRRFEGWLLRPWGVRRTRAVSFDREVSVRIFEGGLEAGYVGGCSRKAGPLEPVRGPAQDGLKL